MKNGYRVYEVNSKKNGTFGIAIVIFGLLLSVSVCNLFSYAFFSNGISLVAGKQHSVNNFYAVQVDGFDDYDKANEYALKLQKQGGAGYITFNKEYKVLSSLYLTYEDAKSVVDNIKAEYPEAAVYEFDLPDIDLPSGLDDEQRRAISTSFAVTKSCIATMTNIYLALDTGEIKEPAAHTMLSTLYEDCTSQADSIRIKFHSRDTAQHLKHEMYLNDFASHIAEINKLDLKGMELSQIIKYQQIKCAFLYIAMCNLF